MKRAAILAVLLLGNGCTFNGTANLYPANEVAQELGAFSILYKDIGLQGTLDFITPDGEAFHGNYTTIDSSMSGYQWGIFMPNSARLVATPLRSPLRPFLPTPCLGISMHTVTEAPQSNASTPLIDAPEVASALA